MVLGCTFSVASAYTMDMQADYTGSSRFDKVHVSAATALNLNAQAGLEATFASDHHYFKDPVYSVAVPLLLDFDLLKFRLRPFYYFKNKSDTPEWQDSSAFGIQGALVMTLNENSAEDIYTYASIGAAFARQQGTLFYKQDPAENRYYNQMAYSLELEQALYRTFDFRFTGTVFQYPDGISNVSGLRSVMDQQDLANTQTLDIVHDLAKYTLAVRAARLWSDNNSAFYVGYRFGEYYTAHSEHSILVGNTFPLTKRANLDVAYNHVRDSHNHNRRDIWQARLAVAF